MLPGHKCSAIAGLCAVLSSCGAGRKKNSIQPRLLLLDAVVRGNDELASLLARHCRCDVIRSRDVVTPHDCVSGVVLVHSPMARQLYDAWRHGSVTSAGNDVFTATVSGLVSRCRDVASLIRVYHVCYLDSTRLDDNSHIIQ